MADLKKKKKKAVFCLWLKTQALLLSAPLLMIIFNQNDMQITFKHLLLKIISRVKNKRTIVILH